jgi:hypothetical protein
VLTVLLRYTDSDYLFGIFILFLFLFLLTCIRQILHFSDFFYVNTNTSTQICNLPTQICNTPTQICNAPTQICRTTTQICNTPTQICNTPTQICNTPTLICNTPTQICNLPTQICNTPTQICNALTQICRTTTQICNIYIVVLIVPLMIVLHQGHFLIFSKQFLQVTKCPHGTNVMPTFSSKQILHVYKSRNSSFCFCIYLGLPPTKDIKYVLKNEKL